MVLQNALAALVSSMEQGLLVQAASASVILPLLSLFKIIPVLVPIITPIFRRTFAMDAVALLMELVKLQLHL
jgi:hypothetical protein